MLHFVITFLVVGYFWTSNFALFNLASINLFDLRLRSLLFLSDPLSSLLFFLVSSYFLVYVGESWWTLSKGLNLVWWLADLFILFDYNPSYSPFSFYLSCKFFKLFISLLLIWAIYRYVYSTTFPPFFLYDYYEFIFGLHTFFSDKLL